MTGKKPPALVDLLMGQLEESFTLGRLQQFREFVKRNSTNKRWLLTSDYNWNTPDRPHDVAAFSVLPMYGSLEDIRAELSNPFPADFKNIRRISPKSIQFFRDPTAGFHFCWMLNRDNEMIAARPNETRLDVARRSIAETLAYMEKGGKANPHIRAIKQLAQSSQANNFQVAVFEDVLLVSLLYTFIVGLLAQECEPKMIAWCPDRDRLSTWKDGMLFTYALINAHRYAAKFGVRYEAEQLPYIDLQGNDMRRYDPLVRPPDYLAGPLSSWSLDQNAGMEGAEKYGQIFRDVLAENGNIALHRIRLGNVLHVTRIDVGPRVDG